MHVAHLSYVLYPELTLSPYLCVCVCWKGAKESKSNASFCIQKFLARNLNMKKFKLVFSLLHVYYQELQEGKNRKMCLVFRIHSFPHCKPISQVSIAQQTVNLKSKKPPDDETAEQSHSIADGVQCTPRVSSQNLLPCDSRLAAPRSYPIGHSG